MSDPSSPRTPLWITEGRGLGPSLAWTFHAEGGVTGLALARESGEFWVADASCSLTRLGRRGQIEGLTRLSEPATCLAIADTGHWGAVLEAETTVHRFDRNLQFLWSIVFDEPVTGLAVSPFGQSLAVSLADGSTRIYNEAKRKTAEFETIRPLTYLCFCATEPLLFAAAEHGLVCCHSLQGTEVWQQRTWSACGGLNITGDGELLYLIGFNQGIQTFDGDGRNVGSYMLDGTIHRLAVSFDPQRLVAASVEQHLYWIDADGQLLWATVTPSGVSALACDPLGEWAVCGLDSGEVLYLDWQGPSRKK